MTLNELTIGSIAIVKNIIDNNNSTKKRFKIRLEAMGLIPGKPVQVIHIAWLGGPLVIRVGSTTEIIMRRSEAELVVIELI
ncbi:MAG: ferrous iron transport protein A (plasmid) [cyanobacterium endosymbiont of Epithemia adnata isolate EadnSB Bon19]|jgi:ferrous iron transport protein A